ncbi:MAG: hypothetical protein HF976_00125 [ANME-2 cluster archaeon]|nr:hypothetical protein [ANME-2 cluster archaeon]MBC2699823.1 hypothetical protein [ANME-2 cluster archaeon]MBC2707042.1 hypothetical protein [ANME-2 cluster archaeon]MBC2748007.1 hypothetical protein [ANME-2 cluster archaeon]MBC2764071.1 hypothetical protein [ANME-2 cluster archaeon]
MKKQSVIIYIIFILTLSSIPIISTAEPNSKLIRELSIIDSFHPELSGDSYKEWHYFNFIDEENNLKFFVTFLIAGNLDNQLQSYGSIIMAYNIEDNFGGSSAPYSISEIEYSIDSPDLTIRNNYVELLPNGYKVHAEGLILPSVEYKDSIAIPIIFDATYIPMAEPTSIFQGTIGDSYKDNMNWVSTAPACKVIGNLIIGEEDYLLDGVQGYHDHNWGTWSWGDNIGWDWGQGIEANNDDADTDVGRYCIVLGRLTDSSHFSENGNRLLLWKNKHQIAVFENVVFEYEWVTVPYTPHHYLSMITATAEDDSCNTIISTFSISNAIPLVLCDDPQQTSCTTILELTGTYDVSGTIDGKPINFQAAGFAEYCY